MKNLDLSIIIVSFNTRELTIECIKSILRTVNKVSFEIIVVDNASSDGSPEAIRRSFAHAQDKIFLIKNSENFGFSKANNIGVRKSVGRHVLFLNSDTLVYEKAIDGMVEFMDSNKEAGAATCFVRLPSGELDDAAHRGFPTPWRAFSHFSGLSNILGGKIFGGYNLKYLKIDKTHEIEALAGAFMLVRREAGEQVGWWDEAFFWYGEDLDFCFRLKERGWRIYFVAEFEILHYKGASGGIKDHSKHLSTATEETRKRAQEARFAAMRIFYEKHYKDKYPTIVTKIVLAGISTKKFISK